MAKVEEHEVFGWAARDRSGILSPIKFSRRTLRPSDVRFKVLYCGVCHTDLHNIKDEWGISIYPVVPGHEIAGEVTELGSEVKNFKIGDKVGVGYFAGSCRSCEACNGDLENYCPQLIPTCNGKDFDGTVTYGGYSDQMVVDEHYAVRIPDNLPLEAAAPLLCAGITVYSPLRYYGMDQAGKHIGVVGLGGLGHIAVKFAKAFGAEVTVISSSPHKKEESLNLLGADSFLVSRDQEQMQAAAGTFDGIIDTVSAAHPVGPLLSLLKLNGKLVMVGIPEKPLEVAAYHLIAGRKTFAGSSTGGMKETQEMIDFAAKHGIKPEIEVIPMDYINTAMDRMVKSDVRYRFVIDIGNTLSATKP